MPRRPTLLLALTLLLTGLAWAGGWIDGNSKLHPTQGTARALTQTVRPSLQSARPPVRPSHARVSGPVYAVHAVDIHGQETTLDIDPGLDLRDPLPVPEGAVELVLELGGPATLTLPGQPPQTLDLSELQVILADPDAAAERGAVSLERDGDGWIGVGW